jgi:uncharacterized membrane protein
MKWVHRLLSLLLAVAFALVLATSCTDIAFPGNPGWPEALLISLATVSTLVALSRQLPPQNVLLAAGGIALIGGAAHVMGATMSFPFGPFIFGDSLGPKIFNTLPWAIPLLWVVTILNSRGVARLILRPWRKTRTYGFRVIGLTAALTMLLDFAFEPFASRVKHYWLWEPTKFPLAWQGAPLSNFLGWAVVSLLILAFVTPVLIRKRPVPKRPPDFHPLGVWLGAVLLFAAASATHELWPAVGTDAAIGIVTIVLAVRGARW